MLGPDVADPKMRYMDSRLACASCHIGAGVEPGNLSLVDGDEHYPRISPRSGANETIQDRINGCMTRSMNGRALAENSPEMIAMVSYLRFLADQDAATGASQRKAHEPAAFKTPNRAADLEAGQQVFEQALRGLSRARWCRACAPLRDPVHGLRIPAAVGTQQLQRRRGHAPRPDRRPIHQGAHAAGQRGPR